MAMQRVPVTQVPTTAAVLTLCLSGCLSATQEECGGVAAPTPYPRTLLDFQRAFPDDAACARYLVERRRPSRQLPRRYVFRFNRRFYKMAGFETLLGLSASQAPTAWEDLRGPLPDDDAPRRRGKATGLTRLNAKSKPAIAVAQQVGDK